MWSRLKIHCNNSLNILQYYEGRTPILMISDKELIRLILTQNFDHFNGRRVLDLGHDLFTGKIT